MKRRRTGEPRKLRNALFKAITITVALSTVLLLLRPVLSEHYASRNPGGEQDVSRASGITGEDARYHYLLGLAYYNVQDRENIKKAMGEYRHSLEQDPTDSQVWLALARACRDYGMDNDAAFALARAVRLDQNNPALVWESGVFYLGIDNVPQALGLLRRYISMVPGEQENVYALAYRMKVGPDDILENLVPGEHTFYSRYLDFLMANGLLDETREAWKRLKAFNPDKKEYLRYCDFLIQEGDTVDALTVWDDFKKGYRIESPEGEAGSMIWNGDFEIDIENGGFDWRIGRAEGVKVFRDRDIKKTGDASLSARFDGNHNPGIQIALQIVPVEPRMSYRLTAYIKTENITTTNGVFLEAAGHRCDPFVKRSEILTGTNLWNRVELDFTTPGDCKTVGVGLKRERSSKFDNKIGGDVWIDHLSMVQTKNN